jgi:hypothetical protein
MRLQDEKEICTSAERPTEPGVYVEVWLRELQLFTGVSFVCGSAWVWSLQDYFRIKAKGGDGFIFSVNWVSEKRKQLSQDVGVCCVFALLRSLVFICSVGFFFWCSSTEISFIIFYRFWRKILSPTNCNVLWGLTNFTSEFRCFGGTYCLGLQGRRVSCGKTGKKQMASRAFKARSLTDVRTSNLT